MIHINTAQLSSSAAKIIFDRLREQQNRIGAENTFIKKVARAKSIWDSKKNSPKGKLAFDLIKKKLIESCVSTEICNYCEHNEATDIEHIYPKKLFPERTFKWKNYLLACSQCNSDYKKDRFAVFLPQNSNQIFEFESSKNYYRPKSNDAAFIDLRSGGNPMTYLWLNLNTGRFEPHPDLDCQSRGYKKAEMTLKILKLNERNGLTEARKTAFSDYTEDLRRYVGIKESNNFEQLKAVVKYPYWVDEAVVFEDAKQNALDYIKNDKIKKRLHPTVWLEMQRQQYRFPQTFKVLVDLFNLADELIDPSVLQR
jgi:uncharacterized protein (TIGR02646 family)